MLSQYDLYDLTLAFIAVRDDVENPSNSEVLSKIISELEHSGASFEDNRIRKALASINSLDRERWQYVYHHKECRNRCFLSNTDICNLFIELCKEEISILERRHFERAYDLIDAYHCLPNIVADNHFSVPKNFWKIYMKPYRKKWDKDFLVAEQKCVRTKNNTGDGSLC